MSQNILEEVKQILVDEYKAGATQAVISKKYGISRNHLTNILNGKRSLGEMRLSTFLKMFPRMSINLTGDNNVLQHGQRNAHGVASTGGIVNQFSGSPPQKVDTILEMKILKDSDICSDCKVKVLQLLHEKNMD